jgi:hypothetical protein
LTLRTNMYIEFAERLAVALASKSIKHSPTVLANQFNSKFDGRAVTPHTARNWMLGKSMPTQDKMICLAQLLETSAELLRYGRHSEKTLTLINADGTETELSSKQQQLVRKYISLNKVQQRLVSDLVGEMAD